MKHAYENVTYPSSICGQRCCCPFSGHSEGQDAQKKIVTGIGLPHGHAIKYLGASNCSGVFDDVDSQRVASGMNRAKRAGEISATKDPQGTDDFRRILDDKSIDAVSIAAPNFWHTPMAILAMEAGKHGTWRNPPATTRARRS